MKVYVTGYENAGGVSEWDWFYKKPDADKRLNSIKECTKDNPQVIIYNGELIVQSINKDDITDEVEKFLSENDWENSFNKKT